ncbi:MAG: type II secretion system F family protein [Caldisericia bacterium]|nr:type II secretion system F family protein [Caldisericia bacterium]
MNSIEYTLIVVIFVMLIFYLLVRLLYANKDRKKRSTDLLFGMEDRKRKRKKSPNFIIQLLNNLSKPFYKIFPVFGKIATKKTEEVNKATSDKLEKAGRPFDFDTDDFNKLKLFCAVTFLFLMFIVATGNENPNYYLYAVISGVVGFFYPDLFIMGLLQTRAKKISLELPNAMDFIALCLAAGMNFQLAVEEYSKRNSTILADEFDIFINDVQVGVGRVDAFQHLLDRNGSPEFRSFLVSIIQGERLGTPLRPVIMSQAEELRGKRKINVEKEIATAPTKMLFPLVMFILPAMLMIILGSVLLPKQEKKELGMGLTLTKFIYYQVTPGVNVFVNTEEYPVYEIQISEDYFTKEKGLEYQEGAIETPSQLKYAEEFFQTSSSKIAWFARLDLPEGELVKYHIVVVANNGQKNNNFIATKYVTFFIEEANEDGILYSQNSKKIAIRGRVTPNIKVKAMLDNKELIGVMNEETGEFYFENISVSNKTNPIQFTLEDSLGLSIIVEKKIEYTGIFVNAAFSQETTINPVGNLTGTATANSFIKMYKVENGKMIYLQTIEVDQTGIINEMIPIEPGVNQFQIYATFEAEQEKSPKRKLSITRSLIP